MFTWLKNLLGLAPKAAEVPAATMQKIEAEVQKVADEVKAEVKAVEAKAEAVVAEVVAAEAKVEKAVVEVVAKIKKPRVKAAKPAEPEPAAKKPRTKKAK